MARKQITDRSSAADQAQAADELRRARAEFEQWFENAKVDPNTPRDIFNGVDYGPLITYKDLANQKRIIAGNYDYVDFGNLESPSVGNKIVIGGEDFYVPGFGSNPDALIETGAPFGSNLNINSQTGAPFGSNPNTNEDAALNAASSNNAAAASSGNAVLPFSDLEDVPGPGLAFGSGIVDSNTSDAANIGDRLVQVTNNDQARDLEAFGSVGNNIPVSATNRVSVSDSDPRGRNQIPTTPSVSNLDDSGSISGTGIERGRITSRLDTKGQLTTSDTVDGDRFDSKGQIDTNDGTVSTSPGNISESDAVDVSSLGQARDASGVGLYEVNPVDLEIRQNVLHNYVNWTYNISMYMLDLKSFTDITANGGVTNPAAELKNLLFRSGGAGRKGILGEQKDYHIDNFRFTSVVGQNSQGARSSNNFDIAFDIHEPYGVAFLAELVQLAHSKGIEDHFDVPYLMEIKFNGYDSQGNPVPSIPNSGPKYIPIKIIDIKFTINSAATVYHVTAVPYAHLPLQDQHDAFLKDSVSLTGETFEQLLGSLSQHMNQAEANKAKEEQREPDTYQFLISDEDLRNSKVGFTHESQGGVVDVARQGMTGQTDEAVQINANSTIKSAIQAISNATDFGAKFNTTGQPESNQGNENLPYRLIKVVPVVTELGPYNTSTMRYRKTVVFKIETQKMYGFITPGMPNAGAQTRGWQKEYNWIFTGKNQDIVDFQAEYNIQYFQIRNSFVDKKGKVTGVVANPGQQLVSRNINRTEAGGNTFNPALRTTTQPITDQIYNSYRGAGHQQASDNMDNVLNNPGADMIVVDLKIIGDPDWIPQDRSILPKGSGTSGDARIVNGSMAVDLHDSFVMLKFRTPRDYNPEKGLMQIDTEQTFVQGLYRVITLESVFESGKFQQNLKLIRIQDQVSNDASNIPPLTSDKEFADFVSSISKDPDRGTPTDRFDSKGQIGTNSNVSISTPLVDDEFVGTGVSSFQVPVGTVSSARPAGEDGTQPLINAGDETNGLDALADTNNLFNGN